MQKTKLETIEPIGLRVVIMKDEDRKVTSGGIALPSTAEIPTITGRIVAISKEIELDIKIPLRQYDKVLFYPRNSIPVDFEGKKNQLVVPVKDVVAVFRKAEDDEDDD